MASQQQYDGLENSSSSSDLDKGDNPGCIAKCIACPGKFCHFLYHDGFFCLLSPLTWCQLMTFLICLWTVSGLFWWLMFYFVVEWPSRSLWAFLVCWGLFTALFVVLMAMDIDDDKEDGLGCTEKELKDHISRLMNPKMDWDTFGYKWHIVPRTELHEDNPSAEVADRIRQVCQRMHYTNTIPVWADEIARGSAIKQVNPNASEETAGGRTAVAPEPGTTSTTTTTIESKAVTVTIQQ